MEIKNSYLINFEGYDNYLGSMGKKSRQNLKRIIRKLFHDYDASLVKYTDPDDVPEFMEHLDSVFKNCWQARTYGYTRRNTLDQIEYYTKLAREGWLRSYILFIDDKPVAFEHTLQYENHCSFQECGFDQTYSKFGGRLNRYSSGDQGYVRGKLSADLGFWHW